MELLVTKFEDIELDVTCAISNGLACSHAIGGHDFNFPCIPEFSLHSLFKQSVLAASSVEGLGEGPCKNGFSADMSF